MKKTLTIVAVIALVSVICLALVACVPQSYDKVTAKLDKNEYKWEKSTLTVTALNLVFSVGGVDSEIDEVVVANKGTDFVTVILFDEKEDAKNAFSLVEDYAKEHNKEEGLQVKMNGKVIYYGTAAGVAAIE